MCVDRVLWCLQRLRDYAALGVNRFSMGVQSFQQEMLAACGRSHTLKEVSAVEVSMVGDWRSGIPASATSLHSRVAQPFACRALQQVTCWLAQISAGCACQLQGCTCTAVYTLHARGTGLCCPPFGAAVPGIC